MKCILRSMGKQNPIELRIYSSIFCLVSVLSLTSLVSSQLSYHVESLVDTRNAMLNFSDEDEASAKSASPSNSFLKTVDEVEKSVYESQALQPFYVQSPARLKKIEKIIKLAANQSNDQSFIRQSLGHALYTAREIERKKPRMKRCSLCRDAMREFMKMIEREIGKEKFQKFIGTKNLDRTTLMFAIDDTGSMSDEIQAAKDIATYIVNISRPNLEVDYILSPFNDPEKGRVFRKNPGNESGKEFIAKINELRAHGGGDCPEMAFKGIIEALNAGPENDSPLYIFTDAPPKDATLDNIEVATNHAKLAGINVYFFATRGCGDPSSVKPFENLARDTCGQVFSLPKNRADIARMKKVASGLLGGTTCAGGLGSFSFRKKRSVSPSVHRLLVDDTMEKIIVSVSSENSGADVNLKDPLESFVTSGKSVLSKVTIFDVKNPTPGIWQLVVSPKAGNYTYLLKGSSKTNVVFDFIFVIPRRSGAPFPIPYPLKGKTAHVILIVRGAEKLQPSSLNLTILNNDGRPLHTASLRQVGGDSVHFSASFPTPAVPFKMQLKGKTKKNFQFERNSQSTVEPSHVVVKLMYARNESTASKSSNEFAMFFIFNSGATEKFKFQIKETVNFKAEYSASPITVYQNRHAVVQVDFIAKSSAVPGSVDQLLVSVTGETSKVTASNIVSLMVVP